MRILAFLSLMAISGCVTEVAAVGKTTRGAAVTGQLSAEMIDKKVGLKVSIVTVSHGICSGEAAKTKPTAILTIIPLKCSSGSRGRATVTSDYINGRDTIVYQVGGERGSIVAGLSVQVAG